MRTPIHKIIMLLIAFLGMQRINAQAPGLMNYQAVVRNASGVVVPANIAVKLKFTIHNVSDTGPVVFTETQSTTTNQFGLVNVRIGASANLALVDWSNGAKYLQVEVDINNTGTFTDMGSSQLISVPYALFAANSIAGPQGVTGSRGATGANGLQGITGATGIQGPAGNNGLNGATGATGAQGLQGITGANGQPGVTGPTGAQGLQGFTGAQGPTGNNGLNGVTGATGSGGIQGVTGATGADGLQGATGADGQPGMMGATGVQGPQGAVGATGAEGQPGAQGPTGNNGLDGVTGATGAQGIQGATGADGQPGMIGATGVQGLQGPTGAVGATGADGQAGATGAMGLQGPTGNNGLNGITGATGAQGIQGATGADGQPGMIGATGVQGLQGPTGAVGATGTDGQAGATGAQGLQGPTGNNGLNGITGATGAQGIQGVTGVDGQAGATGAQGLQGPTGAVGATGADGLAGATGAIGLQGPTGNNGLNGVTGATGASGNDGVAGATGAQGIQGVTGATGAQGPTGTSGWGLTGNSGTTPGTNFIGTTDSKDWVIKTNNTERARFSSAGNMGIGITVPSAPVHIRTADLATNAASLRIQPTGFASDTVSQFSLIDLWSTFDNFSSDQGPRRTSSIKTFFSGGTWGHEALTFNVGGSNDVAIEPTERVRITATGNMGIGTKSPSQTLHVSDASTSNVAYKYGAAALVTDTNIPRVYFEQTGGTATQRLMDIDYQAGGLHFGALTDNAQSWVNQYILTVLHTGYVGIGLQTPGAYLDVTGSNSNSTSLQLRSGNFGNPVTGISSNQITFGYNGNATYMHAIKTRHNSGSATQNAIDFYVWNYGTDAATTVGTKRIMTIDGAGNGRVGIGTAVPDTTLHIVGSLKMVDGNQGAGKIMTSDANGVGIWTTPSVTDTQQLYLNNGSLTIGGGNTVSIGNAWQLTGNTGTSPGTNFIGTTDAQPLMFKVNGNKAGYLDYSSTLGNTAIGYQAQNSVTGSYNTALGYQAMYSATSGTGNVAMGVRALYSTTTGKGNVAIGDSAMYSNTSDTSKSVAIGTNALGASTIGYHIVAIGYGALAANTTGVGPTAIGYNALNSYNPGGATPVQSWNTAVGDYAMRVTTTGNTNTAVGANTLMQNTTGTGNTTVGALALLSSTTSDSSVAIGLQSLYSASTGDGNTAVGVNTLKTLTTGNYNTALGYGADLASAALTNATAIGYNAKVATSNSLVLGGTGGAAVNVGIGTTSPATPLDVASTTTTNYATLTQMYAPSNTTTGNYTQMRIGVGSAANNSGEIRFQYNGSGNTTNLLQLGLFGGGNNGISITGGGNVGINTPTPTQATLVVNGFQANTTFGYGYLNSSGSTGTVGSATPQLSIYASQRIAATEYEAYSDARIKKITGVSDNAEDLNTLAQIKITNYRFIDTIGKGAGLNKKVIAQQLEAIYPQAVNKITDVVPDIYKLAEIKNGYITIENNLHKGDKVKLVFGTHTDLYEVVTANKNGFSVNANDEGKVFVYGTQVSDFRTVDYEALTTLNVSATQELLKMINELKDENSTLRKGKADASDVEQLKLQVEELKKLVDRNGGMSNK